MKTLSSRTVATLVKDSETASEVIAELLERFSSERALKEMKRSAADHKQTVKTVAQRRANNLLNIGYQFR